MAEQNSNEVMIQLPWTVPQEPLYTTHVGVNPETKKIPLDVNVSSTDWVVVVSVIASAVVSFIGFLITIYVVKHSTKSHIESNKQLIDSHEKQKIMELEMIYHKKWFDEVVDCVAELNSRLAEWAPSVMAIHTHLMKEKDVDESFQIFQNEYFAERVREFDAEAKIIYKYISKIIILLKIRELLSQSLERDLLDIQIKMNKQTENLYAFKDFTEGNKEIYMKNLLVVEQLKTILSDELVKFKKAA